MLSLALSRRPSLVDSDFGAEREQLDPGAEEGVQPALVGHALLHHFLLPRVLSSLLDGVCLGELGRKAQTIETQTKSSWATRSRPTFLA